MGWGVWRGGFLFVFFLEKHLMPVYRRMTVLFLFSSYCILLGLLRSDSLLRSIPFVNKLIEVVTELWVPFTNYIDYVLVCVGSYYLYLMFELRSKFFNKQVVLLKTSLLRHSPTHSYAVSNPSVTVQATRSQASTAKVAVVRSMNRVSSTLSLATTSATDFNFRASPSSTLPLIKNFNTKVLFVTLRNSNFPVASAENVISAGESKYSILEDATTLQLTLNPYSTSQIQKDAQFIPNNLNIMGQMSLAKQDRWFLKNSLLGDSLVKSTSNFTQSKKLITSNLLAGNTSNNVWLSSKVGGLNSAEAYKFASFLNKSVSGNESNTSHLLFTKINNSEINFFEDSRFFFSKRYFFLNQLKNNLWESQTLQSNIQSPVLGPKVGYIPFVYSKSLVFNISELVSLEVVDSSFTQLIDSSPNDVDVSFPNNSMLGTNNINFVNKLTSLSSNAAVKVTVTKVTSPLLYAPEPNNFLTE